MCLFMETNWALDKTFPIRGKLDFLIEEARKEKVKGKLKIYKCIKQQNAVGDALIPYQSKFKK